jgi:putative tryptophan/tyrosine transport system substrate-binding protein
VAARLRAQQPDRMRRIGAMMATRYRTRRFAATLPILLVMLLVFASAAVGQPAPRVARVGMLCSVLCTVDGYDALSDELRKLGWIEGTTIVIERKEAGRRFDRLPELAADLVRSKPDLIVAFTPQPSRAAKDATSEIPIVMLFVADPVAVGLAASLAHPGGNLTGVATLVPGAFMGKPLDIVRELLPQAKRVAALINPSNESNRLLFPREAPPAAAKLGFQLDVIEVREAGEIPGAIATAKAGGAEVLWIVGDPIFHSPPNMVPDLASQAGLPSIYLIRDIVQAGGLISYGPDFLALFRRGAYYVDRILKGAKPADLPIEQPSKFLLAINLKTAKSLGLDIPPSLLARADEVFE